MKSIFAQALRDHGDQPSRLSRGPATPDHRGTATAIDGDTTVHGTRIRLTGIDAPESARPCRRRPRQAWRCGQRRRWR
ncbi:hypothetical protein DPM13_00440 [Paracoccus mutanolyticus]|uniref:Uncharacterized protein n=1 Tax=Paracoccus mutanolyticus TaxID=1499308 RepID=A0ABM6WNX0_9RHOB|nr:hypothetical protein [Paracoccus mutanolyticus]AWX92279.1 hypothetical protein DPM13_00440 [Paracoccus mutanolyticus]